MPTDAFATRASPPNYVWLGVACSLGLFALLRLRWVEAFVVLPFTEAQATLAAAWFGPPALPLAVTLACSGADAMALCLGAVLAYPVPWGARLTGAAGAAALVLTLNTTRIGTLGLVAGSRWFVPLHLYVWPLVLTLAIAVYVFTWMRVADRPSRLAGPRRIAVPSRRFVVLTLVFLVVFVATAPLYLESRAVLALAGVVAGGASFALRLCGMNAHTTESILWTNNGGFLVTQECIATPLIPVYLAMVGAYAPTARRAVFAVLATLPIFVALGIVRLLLVALPPAIASPLFWVHGFYQLVAALLLVVAAACWRNRAQAGRRAVVAVASGLLCGILLAPLAARLIAATAAVPQTDSQGAIAFLPVFQVAFYVALCVAASTTTRWTRLAMGLGGLAVSVAVTLAVLRVLAIDLGVVPHVRDIRAWAIAAPLMAAAAVLRDARTGR